MKHLQPLEPLEQPSLEQLRWNLGTIFLEQSSLEHSKSWNNHQNTEE
jgi:hypothetical protein